MGRIERSTDKKVPRLTLIGEFDLSNAPELVKYFDDLADAACTKVIIDVGKTTFIDSTILGAFALAYRRGLLLDIRGASGAVRREIDMSGLSAVFDIS